MAKRRASAGGEVSLFPFLSILACLIGALVLIIVVLCVAQTQQSDGRTKEEMDQAREYQDLLRKEKEQKEIEAILTDRLAKLEKLKEESAEKQQRLAKLRVLLATSADVKKMNQEIGQNLLKELDNLLLEITGLTDQQKTLNEEIAKLMAEIKSREVPLQKVVPPVVVQPSGSGYAQGTKMYFVEATGGKLTIFWDQKQRTVVSATPAVIIADEALNYFLKEVIKVPQARIIFLMRDDGTTAFNNAAGWAQSTYGYRVDQIGRLLIPGRGEIDLQMFKDFFGTMAPPPEAKIVTPPAPAPPKPAAPAAPKSAPATAPETKKA